jgi:hypothetical protein
LGDYQRVIRAGLTEFTCSVDLKGEMSTIEMNDYPVWTTVLLNTQKPGSSLLDRQISTRQVGLTDSGSL